MTGGFRQLRGRRPLEYSITTYFAVLDLTQFSVGLLGLSLSSKKIVQTNARLYRSDKRPVGAVSTPSSPLRIDAFPVIQILDSGTLLWDSISG